MEEQKYEVLRQYFGYSSFRSGQEELIDRILSGQDALGIMPTGAGKSICFQVPALLFSGITLVISPLISLMKDQVGTLVQNGVPAAFLNSSLTPAQYEKVLINAAAGMYKILYVAPERLMADGFLDFAQSAQVSMISIDEAHCVSQWGQDFRPSYLKILEFIDALEVRPVVSAFTATATHKVREDIVEILRLREPFVITTGFDRENLSFEVQNTRDKMGALKKVLEKNGDNSGVIYCATRKNVEQVCDQLCSMGYPATRYHAGLTDRERKQNQEDFIFDQKRIMVATNAFGMGIDKSNVSFVVHYNMPKNLESYYQEAGRAGRDGEPASCILLYSGQDVVTNQFLIERTGDNPELSPEMQQLVQEQERIRLKEMTFYCHTSGCLRQYILNYFGEKTENYCGNCSNCLSQFETRDVTVDAQKIISCVIRMKQNYGIKMVVDVLRGSKGERLTTLGFDQLSTYGLMAGETQKTVRDVINHLILNGFLQLTTDEYPVLKATPQSRGILSGEVTVEMKLLKSKEPDKPAKKSRKPVDTGLLGELKALRSSLAKEQQVPAYFIFTDASLNEMCARMPATEEELLEVPGVGKKKLLNYGEAFLECIRGWVK